jgi:hypothetical protein
MSQYEQGLRVKMSRSSAKVDKQSTPKLEALIKFAVFISLPPLSQYLNTIWLHWVIRGELIVLGPGLSRSHIFSVPFER